MGGLMAVAVPEGVVGGVDVVQPPAQDVQSIRNARDVRVGTYANNQNGGSNYDWRE